MTDRIFLVNVNLRPSIRRFRDSEYPLILNVMHGSRQRLGFLLCGYVLTHMNPVRRGLVKRPGDWRWSSYNNFALDKATVAACPIQIDYVSLPVGYRA